MTKSNQDINLTLTAQNASFLTDMIGLCSTPRQLFIFGKFLDPIITFVTEFTMKFDVQAKEYQQAAAAIYERYYDKVDSEGGKKEVLKDGMNLEDFTNEVKGINDNFISKTDTYKKVEQKFSIDPNIFKAFFEIFLDLDVKKAAEADKNKEIYTAIVYDLTKIFYAASN